MIKIKTRDVERVNFRNYLQKAEECASSAIEDMGKRRWNSAGIMAIHAGISAADAICTYFLGKRYAGERHEGILDLFRTIQIDHELLDKNTMRLSRLIGIKNMAEYEERLLHEDDAARLIKEMQRFLEFIKTQLPK